MKAYKAMNCDMTCRGFKYEEGSTYEEPNAKLCRTGFHACENPVACFSHYAPASSVMHEVELEDVSDEQSADTKVVGKKITIGARLDIPHIVSATFEYVKEHCTNESNAEAGESVSAGYRGAASAGENGAASTGEKGAASAGNRGAASAGWFGAASAGLYGAASAGERGAASAGWCGAASAGWFGAASAGSYGAASAGWCGAASAGLYGAASAGLYGAASAGSYGAAVSRGTAESGANGISVVRGNDVKVKGGLGAILVIAIENESDYNIKEWEVVIVDGKEIKADTWYRLQDGELVECEYE